MTDLQQYIDTMTRRTIIRMVAAIFLAGFTCGIVAAPLFDHMVTVGKAVVAAIVNTL